MIVMLAGPIEYWWDGNWDLPEHWIYAEWRDCLSKELVRRGHLVYRPHEAFKGAWDERAQAVNDRAIDLCGLMIVSNMDPAVPCSGTDAEVAYAEAAGIPVARVVVRPTPAWKFVMPERVFACVNHLERAGLLGADTWCAE